MLGELSHKIVIRSSEGSSLGSFDLFDNLSFDWQLDFWVGQSGQLTDDIRLRFLQNHDQSKCLVCGCWSQRDECGSILGVHFGYGLGTGLPSTPVGGIVYDNEPVLAFSWLDYGWIMAFAAFCPNTVISRTGTNQRGLRIVQSGGQLVMR
jgi:hypothetical protein